MPPSDHRSTLRPARAWWAALALLCGGALWLEFSHIEASMPYPRHVDEGFISGPAHRTLVTGTWHPYTFNYPSLPKYLAAAGMAVGFLRGASNQEITQIQRLGNVGYPYYETRSPMQTARQLFAFLSVVALAATGFCAWLVCGRPSALLLAPLLLVATPLFFFHSWAYLNVDIIGTCFVTLTLAACLSGIGGTSVHQASVVPGALAGLAAASKYTLALALLPVFLVVGLSFAGGRRIWAWSAALAAMAAAFLVGVPYSIIDIPGFLNGLASEAFHYASGHRGFSEEPGLAQLLLYIQHLVSEFGVVASVLAGLGIIVCAAFDWRRTLVLAAFPAGLLWLLASQRVHFTRNALALQPIMAVFATVGVLTLHDWSTKVAARRGWMVNEYGRRARAAAGLVVVLLTVPLWHLVGHFRDRTDSRNVALAWLDERIPRDWTIVVPSELGFDRRGLESAGRNVTVIDLQRAQDPAALQNLLGDVPSPAVIMVPRWGADMRFPGHEAAAALNDLSRRWRVLRAFGTNDVLVNYSYSTAWGDPAFAVAVLK